MAKKGYTKIDNAVFAYLFNNNLNASELKTLLFLIRYTAGFNRATTRASYGYIAKGVGISESSAKKAIKNLNEKGLISIEYPAVGSKAQVVKLSYANLTTLGGQVCTDYMVESDHNNVVESDHQDIKEYIKDKTIKKRKASPHSFPNYPAVEYTVEELYAWKDVMKEEDFEEFKKGKVWE